VQAVANRRAAAPQARVDTGMVEMLFPRTSVPSVPKVVIPGSKNEGRSDVRHPGHMLVRGDIGDDVRARLAAAAPGYPGALVAAGELLGIQRTAARSASRVSLTCVGIARSQHSYRRSMTRRHAIGVRDPCGRSVARQDGEALRPHYGKIKAARCGPVGWLKKVGTSAPWNEVHFSPRAALPDNARKINARHTSRARALSTSAVRADRSVAPRVFRLFGSAFVSWHTAAKVGSLAGGPGRKNEGGQ